jgi:hypothetical protein
MDTERESLMLRSALANLLEAIANECLGADEFEFARRDAEETLWEVERARNKRRAEVNI